MWQPCSPPVWGPIKVLAAWGNSDGFWGLLAFSMQMALVLVLGSRHGFRQAL